MGRKETVLKVSISSNKCQQEIFSAVAKIPGIEKLEMDVNKSTLTVVGQVEPVPIFKALKKIGKKPEIVRVGPPRPQRCGPYCYCSSCQPFSDQKYGRRSPPIMPCHPCCDKSCCKQPELPVVGYPLSLNHGSGQCCVM